MAFLKVLEDGSHMIMMECPEAVNTLLHEFFLWEPTTPLPPKNKSKTRPDTAKAQAEATSETAQVRPETARNTSSNGGAEEEPESKAKKWLRVKTSSGSYTRWWLAMHFVMSQCVAQLKVGLEVGHNAGSSSLNPPMSAAELKDNEEKELKWD